jgi:hypothetical protein
VIGVPGSHQFGAVLLGTFFLTRILWKEAVQRINRKRAKS